MISLRKQIQDSENAEGRARALAKAFLDLISAVPRAALPANAGLAAHSRESLEKAAAKTAEYEAALRAARAEVYQTQEQLHRRLQDEQSTQVHQARQQAEAAVRDAKAQLAAEIAQAKTDLAAQGDSLASQIADTILNRGAAA